MPKPKHTDDELWDLYISKGSSAYAVAKELGLDHSSVAKRIRRIMADLQDAELVESNVKLAKQRQYLQDTQRIERKAFREHARVENAVAEYGKELRATLKGFKFSAPPKKPCRKHCQQAGIIHWSDQHLNERVNLPHNQYDWEVASRRLRKHVQAAIRHFKAHEISKVLVAMTGDLLNSDRRLDELLSNAGNRAKASVLAVDLYQQALREVAEHFDVTVAGVSGNESRIPQHVGWAPEVASDNYDFAIYEMLRLMLDGKGMRFVEPSDPGEMVVRVGNQHVLMMHGHGAVSKDPQKSVQEIAGRYTARGVKVDFVIWGHIHCAHIGDGFARSSSLVGSNDFAEKALNLTGRASQNLYILHESGGFDGIKVDLQDTTGITGYNLQKRLETYNTKSADKVHATETIFRIVI